MALLREKLLEGRRIALAGAVPPAGAAALRALGAELESLSTGQLQVDDEHVGDWARLHAPLHALIWSGAGAFGDGGERGLNATLDEAWAAVREVAIGALIPGETPAKLLLIAPRPDAGPFAEGVRSGLENLARTLSVEWARFGLTSVAIAPGSSTTEDQLGELICFVMSDAGAYLSGCRLDLGAVA